MLAHIGLIILGMFIGANLALIAYALCVAAAKRNDEWHIDTRQS